jgi:hypothetical protein
MPALQPERVHPVLLKVHIVMGVPLNIIVVLVERLLDTTITYVFFNLLVERLVPLLETSLLGLPLQQLKLLRQVIVLRLKRTLILD